MCKSCSKSLGYWNQLDSTNKYLIALSTSIGIKKEKLIHKITTGLNDNRGTLVHPKVAINLAQ